MTFLLPIIEVIHYPWSHIFLRENNSNRDFTSSQPKIGNAADQ